MFFINHYMISVKEILESPITSAYTGSQLTKDLISQQIVERWGKAELKQYDPYKNCLPFTYWVKMGFRVRKGEKALRSCTFIEVKDAQGEVIRKIRRTVLLFYYKQVEKAV